MNRKYLAFDLETAKAQTALGRDWKLRRPLGISCAATYLDGAKQPLLWYGGMRRQCPAQQLKIAEAKALVDYLCLHVSGGYTIVTWNGIGFDFDILAEESRMHAKCAVLAKGHVDMMFHVICQLGFGVSLNAAARGMRLTKKCEKRRGALIPKKWMDGKYEQVFNHVAQDVRLTLELAKACNECSYFRWITRFGTGRMMRLPNGWQVVGDVQKWPEPIQTEKRGQWSRKSLTAWMQ